MSDKKINFTAPSTKTSKVKRPSTVTVASTSSNRPKTGATNKEKVSQPRSKFNKNSTISSGEADTTILKSEGLPNLPSFDGEYRQIAYGNFLRAMLEECMVDEKIEREETIMDIQMAQLADRFQKTTDLLDKTNKRLKDVSFTVEQKRLLELKNQHCSSFYETSDASNAQDILQNLSTTEQASLDRLDTKNIDFGFDKNSGHQQLLDAVNDAIEGFRQIKLHSKLDIDKFKEYEKSQRTWTELEKESHAGYTYCGACAAFAYRQVSPVVVKRIFILGPSHHVRLNGCALSSMDKYQTPLYDLTIDKQIYTELEATQEFEWMDAQTDEDEHSIEMHLPYIAKVMEEYKSGFTIIPILVGSISPDKEAKYGALLAPYLADPQNLFVISSDFCHWGSRFRYTWREKEEPIHQSIEWLDKQGMDIIEKLDPNTFTQYLNKYGNTICGRHPIGVLLQAIAKLRSQSNAPNMFMKFLKYAQSSKCMTMKDSSVSYASASLCFE